MDGHSRFNNHKVTGYFVHQTYSFMILIKFIFHIKLITKTSKNK